MMATLPNVLPRVLAEQARSSINPLRACEVCDHGTGGTHTCLYGARAVPASVARSDDGHCGPDARHQRINGDDLQARPGLQLRLA